MKAIILAAGRGTRLRKDFNVEHKSLLKINNISLIKRQIQILRKNNVKDIWIVTGYNASKIKEELLEMNVKFIHNKNFERSDTLESFLTTKHLMNGEMITLYSDVVFQEQIINNLLLEKKSEILLKIDKSKCKIDDMKTIVEENLVKRIEKKLSNDIANSKYIGIAKFSKYGTKVFREILEDFEKVGDIEGDISRVFEEIIRRNYFINADFTEKLKWFNVNTINEFKNAQAFFMKRKYVNRSE